MEIRNNTFAVETGDVVYEPTIRLEVKPGGGAGAMANVHEAPQVVHRNADQFIFYRLADQQ